MRGGVRHLPWRLAAVALLGGGVALALWQDATLLERREVTLPLAGVFALLWMVPVLLQRRIPAPEAGLIRQGDAPDGGRLAIDLTLGGLAGLVAGALYLSFPGSADLLTRGPQAVGWLFDGLEGYGTLAVVVGALLAMALLRMVWTGLMGAVRTSRFMGGAAIGLFLWVPFHGTFQAGLAQIGFDLPGLMTAGATP